MLAAADARVFSCDYDPPSPEHMAVASPESFIGIGRRLGAERIPGLIIIVGLAGDSEGVPCERVREALLAISLIHDRVLLFYLNARSGFSKLVPIVPAVDITPRLVAVHRRGAGNRRDDGAVLEEHEAVGAVGLLREQTTVPRRLRSITVVRPHRRPRVVVAAVGLVLHPVDVEVFLLPVVRHRIFDVALVLAAIELVLRVLRLADGRLCRRREVVADVIVVADVEYLPPRAICAVSGCTIQ